MIASTAQLKREIYGMTQVDHLVRLKAGTARRWIDGYKRDGKRYRPVIREGPTGNELVTWGEFVECRFLAQYRTAGVPIVNMRPVVESLRKRFDTTYPLAHLRLFVVGQEIVELVQQETALDAQLAIVVRTQQLMAPMPKSGLCLTPAAQAFVDAVDWDGDDGDVIAVRIRPMSSQRLVLIDPTRAFGSPTVSGVRTDVVAEEIKAGATIHLVARGFGITTKEVEAAVAFEAAA